PRLGSGLPNSQDSFASSSNSNTIVLSDATWRTVFNADPKIIGETVQMNGKPYTVTGVMPPGFRFPYHTRLLQVWSPAVLGSKDQCRNELTPYYNVLARRRPRLT